MQSPLEKARRSITLLEMPWKKENFGTGFHTTVYNNRVGEGKAMTEEEVQCLQYPIASTLVHVSTERRKK